MKKILTVLMVFAVSILIYATQTASETNQEIEEIKEEILSIQREIVIVEEPIIEEPVVQTLETKVLFTNYYVGDGSSGTVTSSGLAIKDFGVNEYGEYTHNGCSVVAAATKVLAEQGITDGYKTWEIGDTLSINRDGVERCGVVLDACGACTWGNDELQRIDLFMDHSYFGLQEGVIIENLQ